MEKKEPYELLVGMQTDATTMENSVELPQKMKNGTALGPSDSTFRYVSKETQNTNSKEYMHPHVHCRIIYNSQLLETT